LLLGDGGQIPASLSVSWEEGMGCGHPLRSLPQ
jgi:hypothetical protein